MMNVLSRRYVSYCEAHEKNDYCPHAKIHFTAATGGFLARAINARPPLRMTVIPFDAIEKLLNATNLFTCFA